MLFDNFRRQLRQEARIWQDEGLIGEELYEQLAQRYQFNHLETAARERFVFILIAVGVILLGLGVITFVAANWQALSREVKLTLLLSIFLVTNIAGFSLWKQPRSNNIASNSQKRRQHILGEGLLILGALTIGANMALSSQIFHISGSSYELFVAWGLAVLLMAYSLRLTSLGLLSLILLLIGYCTSSFGWSVGLDEFVWTELVVEHLPLVSGLLFVPLAYWCRSRWIFRIAAIAFIISWQFQFRSLEVLQYTDAPSWLVIANFTIPPALLWSYDDLLFGQITSRLFQPFARALASVVFSIMFYLLSYRWLWETRSSNYQTTFTSSPLTTWLPLIDIGIFTVVALWQWWHLLRQTHNREARAMDIKTIVIAGLIVTTAVIIFLHQAIIPIAIIPIIAFNVLLAVLGFGLILEALESGKRGSFWGGMVLLTLQILTRMLEYETGLLLKSLVFVLCGVAVIVAGLWFERYVASLATTTSNGNQP